MRMKVKYSDFQLARAKVKITEIDEADEKKETKPPVTPPKKP